MKKSVKIYVLVWVVVIASAIGAMVMSPSHHDLASDPYAVEKIVKVDLPDIAQVESEDNMCRGTSRWDMYVHRGQFGESLSEESIETMEALCQADSVRWSKNDVEGCYVYNDEGGIDGLYSVSCSIYRDRFVTAYYVDESEGIFGFLLLLILIGAILLIWGLRIASNKRYE